MDVTRQTVADRIEAYLNHRLSLAELVDWAENQMMDADFESNDVRDVVARLGLADVQHFRLSWEHFEGMLADLGYSADLRVRPVSRT